MALVEVHNTRGLSVWAQVDDADLPLVTGRPWVTSYRPRNVYAHIPGSKSHGHYGAPTLMHRLILGAPAGVDVDHINHDGLDNRRCNLRLCTKSENGANRRVQATPKSSRYKGVCWVVSKRRWIARIKVGGRLIYLGRFRSEEDAARAYDAAARDRFGAFALPNLIER